MKGIICYYSGSGNTRLVCNYIQSVLAPIMLAKFKEVNNCCPLPHQWS